jgi:hypothetical protein
LSCWSRLCTWIFPSTSGFWDNWTYIRQKLPLVQYKRAHILEANFFWGFLLSLFYWSYSYVQKIIWQDPSAASSFGEIFNFLRPKNGVKFHWSMPWNLLCDLNLKAFIQFFCKQINYIVCQISEKDHILLIIHIQTSEFAVGRLNNTPLGYCF